MPALDTVGQYLEETRRLLQDEREPYRYPTDDLIDALNIGLTEARRLRADLFLPVFTVPWYDPTTTGAPDLAKKVPLDIQYRSSLVSYMVGRAQLRDEEATTDSRASALMNRFTSQMLTIAS